MLKKSDDEFQAGLVTLDREKRVLPVNTLDNAVE
jgi:hypothetical protein